MSNKNWNCWHGNFGIKFVSLELIISSRNQVSESSLSHFNPLSAAESLRMEDCWSIPISIARIFGGPVYISGNYQYQSLTIRTNNISSLCFELWVIRTGTPGMGTSESSLSHFNWLSAEGIKFQNQVCTDDVPCTGRHFFRHTARRSPGARPSPGQSDGIPPIRPVPVLPGNRTLYRAASSRSPVRRPWWPGIPR